MEYGYDTDSRLTGITYKLGTQTLGTLTYSYDANGQRTAVGGTWARTNLPAALTSATYDNANQIATFGGTAFTYDANGNLTGDGTRTYTWNARNQLASLTGPINASFAFDGLARRRSKTVGSATTQFLYDGLNPVQELASGSPTANLLTGGLDQFFTRTDSNGARHYLTDALGSSVALSDSSGTTQTEYSYDPFGGFTTSGASTANSFAFTGREADGTGLLYYRARYLDPRLQRFIAEDPLGFGGGDPNLHAYVGNSPQNFVDPSGTIPAPLILPLAGCLGGAMGGRLADMLYGRKTQPLDYLRYCLMGLPFGVPGLGPLGPGWAPPLLPWLLPRFWPYLGPAAGAGGAVTFGQGGHGARHAANSGVSPQAIEAAIRQSIEAIARTGAPNGYFWGQVQVGGQTWVYRAMPLPNGTIHIGTYYPFP